MASALDACAGLAVACDEYERALRLAGAAEQMYASARVNASGVYRFRLEVWLDKARQALGPERAAAAVNVGRTLSRSGIAAELMSLDSRDHAGVAARRLASELTAREIDVLRRLTAGKTNREIAGELVVAESTIARHVANIFRKLDVKTRTAAAALAHEQRLLEPAGRGTARRQPDEGTGLALLLAPKAKMTGRAAHGSYG